MLTPSGYSDLRRTKVLITYDPKAASLTALLRVDPRESAETRELVAELGFEPEQSSPLSAVSWTRHVDEHDLATTCACLSRELCGAGVYDLGNVYPKDAMPIRREELPAFWSGPFVVGVKSTPRCLVFDRGENESIIRDAFEAEEKNYYAKLSVPTE